MVGNLQEQMLSKEANPSKGMKDELTPRQLRFINYYTLVGSPTYGNAFQSALKAGYSVETAKQIMAASHRSEKTRKAMADALEGHGVTPDYLAEKHKGLLEKTETANTKDGPIDTGKPDTQAVKAGLDMAYKLKGDYAPEKHQHEITNFEDRLRDAVEGDTEETGK